MTDATFSPAESRSAPEGRFGGPLKTRYRDGYRVARATVAIGTFIKMTGILFTFVVVCVLALVHNGMIGNGATAPRNFQNIGSSSSSNDLPVLIGLGLAAVITGGIVVCLGIMVSAQGQTLKAALDCAVNSSPFLSDDQRAQIMSL